LAWLCLRWEVRVVGLTRVDAPSWWKPSVSWLRRSRSPASPRAARPGKSSSAASGTYIEQPPWAKRTIRVDLTFSFVSAVPSAAKRWRLWSTHASPCRSRSWKKCWSTSTSRSPGWFTCAIMSRRCWTAKTCTMITTRRATQPRRHTIGAVQDGVPSVNCVPKCFSSSSSINNKCILGQLRLVLPLYLCRPNHTQRRRLHLATLELFWGQTLSRKSIKPPNPAALPALPTSLNGGAVVCWSSALRGA
jgi:hypothetical protein